MCIRDSYNGMWAMTEDANFADGEIERFYNETFIAKKTENSIPFGTSIFKNLLLRNTDTFLSKKDIMLSLPVSYTHLYYSS